MSSDKKDDFEYNYNNGVSSSNDISLSSDSNEVYGFINELKQTHEDIYSLLSNIDIVLNDPNEISKKFFLDTKENVMYLITYAEELIDLLGSSKNEIEKLRGMRIYVENVLSDYTHHLAKNRKFETIQSELKKYFDWATKIVIDVDKTGKNAKNIVEFKKIWEKILKKTVVGYEKCELSDEETMYFRNKLTLMKKYFDNN